MTSSNITHHVWFSNKVIEEECTSQFTNMKSKTLVSNKKNAQAYAFVKDWNDGDEEGFNFGGLDHDLEPRINTDFILETKLLQLFPSTGKINVALHADSNKQEGISLLAKKEVESKKEETKLE